MVSMILKFLKKISDINIGSKIDIKINDEQIWLNGKKLDPKSEEYKQTKKRVHRQVGEVMEKVDEAMDEVNETMKEVGNTLRNIFK